MGRKSREKRERVADPIRRSLAIAARAEAQGRRVAATVAAFEQAARVRGESAVVEALISRANQRWENVQKNAGLTGGPVAETLHVLFPLDVALLRLGVRFTEERPADPSGGWLQQLRWGTDSACQVQRMILACNPMGAAAMARTQLERWSLNRTSSNSFDLEEAQSTAARYSAIWGMEGPKVDAGLVWENLSELLHGRGPLIAATRWEVARLAESSEVESESEFIMTVEAAVQLSLRQVLLGAAQLTDSPEFPPGLSFALRRLPLSVPSEIRLAEIRPLIFPLTLSYLEQQPQQLQAYGDTYLQDLRCVEMGTKPTHDIPSLHGIQALMSRRARASSLASFAFAQEQTQLGENFSPSRLASRELSYIMINELAGLLALWTSGYKADAFAAGSSALRAAFWLWLEDDEQTLMLVRSVLEQTARLRTWRMKPSRAALMEAKGSRTSPRDWLESAGWRRLSVLNRSLGEFSHITPLTDHRFDARQALVKILPENVDSMIEPVQMVRGSTLDRVAFAFGAEVFAWLSRYYPNIAEALSDIMPYAEANEAENEIEEWMKRCWDHRGMAFEEPDVSNARRDRVRTT